MKRCVAKWKRRKVKYQKMNKSVKGRTTKFKNVKKILNRNKTKLNKKEKQIQELVQVEGDYGAL